MPSRREFLVKKLENGKAAAARRFHVGKRCSNFIEEVVAKRREAIAYWRGCDARHADDEDEEQQPDA